ncbi:putative nuclease HARBI1 [Vanessa atalanta]|uniref:putative nuclease HARBI1 n=1 Tax=Vanessa atalanta TaxID=42275 RepID=UPI001FCDFAF9|nr:putative nuclease HARBI1 [Vanessa atalanta]
MLRDVRNQLLLPQKEFIAQFRLNKDAFLELCSDVIPKLRATERSHAIRIELKPALSRCLEEFTNALNLPEILRKYIKFPSHKDKRESIYYDQICDAQLNIIYVDASYGGASHNSFIWAQSPIKLYLELRLHSEEDRCWLLSDPGFPQRPYLRTPIIRVSEGAEEYYNKLQHIPIM